MRAVLALVLLVGCGSVDGLDLDSSANPRPYAAREVEMTWTVRNTRAEPVSWGAWAAGGAAWGFMAPAGSEAVERIRCADGEQVTAGELLGAGLAHETCGRGNVAIRF